MTISLNVETGFAILSAGTPHYYKGPQLLWWWNVGREEASVTPLLGFILWKNLCSQAVTYTHVPHFSVFNTLGDAGRLRGLELGISFLLSQLVVGLVAQSCPTLCNPMDSRSPGSSVHGILQTRILEWVSMPFSPWSVKVLVKSNLGLPGWSVVKNLLPSSRPWFDLPVRKIPWRRAWQPTPVCWPGESYRQRSLADCSPWGSKELDMT